MPSCEINRLTSLENATMQILLFSRQSADIHSHGGCRRTAQLVRALSDFDCGFVFAEDYHDALIPEGKNSFVDNMILKFNPRYGHSLDNKKKEKTTAGVYGKWSAEKREYLFYLNAVAIAWQVDLINNLHLKLAIVDDPIYFAPLVKYLHSRGIPIIVHCHNIETMSTPQIIDGYQRELFSYEIDLLAKCEKVITISREESFLLKNLGIEPIYMPYYPVAEIRGRLLSIRNCRETTGKRDVLLLGSVGNMPTMNGMKIFINEWNKAVSSTGIEDRLIVAGFGTEQMHEDVASQSVVFRGAIPDNELDQLLTEIKAAVVYQENGSGALTKICEFLMAGIPVFANQHAARSYYNLPGIIEFKNIEEVFAALGHLANIESKITIPAEPDYSELLSFIKAQI